MTTEESKAASGFYGRGKGIADIKAGANIIIDKSDPRVPKISSTGGGGGGEGGSVDLTDYYNKQDVDNIVATKAEVAHQHVMSEVTGLTAALAAKANSSHVHTISAISGLQTALDGKAPTNHTHPIANITGLQDALDNLAAGQGGEGGTGGIQETNYVGWDEVTPIKKGDILYYFDENGVEYVFLALKDSLNIRPLDNDPSRMAQIEPVMTFDDILVPVAGEVMLKDNFYKESATTPNGDDITFVLKPRNPVEYVDGMGIGIMMGTPQPDIILHVYTGEWEQGTYFKKLGDILNIYTYPMEDQMKSLIRNIKIITTVDDTLYTNDYPLYSESSGYFYERYNKPSIDLYEYYIPLGTINHNGQFSKLIVADGDINIDNYSGYFGGNAKVKLLVGEMDEFNTVEAYLLASDKGIMSGSGIPFYSNYFWSGNFNETADERILTNKAYVDYKISQVEGGGNGGGGDTPLDVEGGALSFERGKVLEDVLKTFVEGEIPLEGETFVFDESVTVINGVTALENTGLRTTGETFTYDQDVRLYTFLNVPTTLPDGRKMTTFKYEGIKYLNTSDANLIGIKDGVLTPLIVGIGSNPGVITEEVDISEYDALHISGNVEFAPETITMSITVGGSESGTMDLEDSVKKYIDVRNVSNNKLNTILYSFLNKEGESGSHKYVFETDMTINSVEVEAGHILKPNNTTTQWSEPGLVLHTFRNISTTIDGVKQNFVHFKGQEIGGVNQHSNMVGIRDDNSIVDILPATKDGGFTPQFHDVDIDISDYKAISVHFVKDANTTGGEQFITFSANKDQSIEVVKDSVKKYIDARVSVADIEKKTYLLIDKPTTMPRICIEGVLPTDASDTRTPTDVVVTYQYNNRDIFKCNSTMAIQGNWTVFENKKGYEFAFTNADGDDLKVQIGDWIPCNEFHFKAYPNDSSFSRDVTAMKIWHQIRTSREWPESYIADFKPGTTGSAAKEDLMSQALFYTDGFPTECYLNGQFQGIYVFRLKKERDNYMLDNSNPNHIFLDNQDTIDWVNFDPADWKVRSPKIAGYEETQPITDVPLMDKLTRWWNWFKALEESTVVYEDTKDDYINEGSWVDAFIAQQVTGHWDYQINNILLTSWDGQRLSVCFYDADQTWGWTNAGSTTGEGIWYRSGWWINTLYPNLLPAIKERYTWLRQNGILTMNNIHNTFRLSTAMISKDMYLKEYAVWPPTHGNAARHTLRNSLDWAQDRLVQLDAVWLLP